MFSASYLMVTNELLVQLLERVKLKNYNENSSLCRMLYMMYRMELNYPQTLTWLQSLFQFFDEDLVSQFALLSFKTFKTKIKMMKASICVTNSFWTILSIYRMPDSPIFLVRYVQVDIVLILSQIILKWIIGIMPQLLRIFSCIRHLLINLRTRTTSARQYMTLAFTSADENVYHCHPQGWK